MVVNECMALRDQLLADSILAPTEINKSLAEATENATDLESVLRKNHVLTEPQLDGLRAMRQGVAFCNLSDFIPRLRNAELLEEALVRRHMMFPLFDFDGVITLVMENPGDLAGIDQVRRLIKREVDVCMGNRSEILGLIERAYGASKYLAESTISASAMTIDEEAADEEAQPVIHLVNDLVNEAIRQNASDIHIEPGEHEMRIRIRVDGVLREIAAPPLGLHRAMVSRVKILSRLDISQTRAPQDGAFSHPRPEGDVVIRVSVLPSIFGESVVMRILRNESESITLRELGMQPKMLERFSGIVSNAHGMILVSGSAAGFTCTWRMRLVRYSTGSSV